MRPVNILVVLCLISIMASAALFLHTDHQKHIDGGFRRNLFDSAAVFEQSIPLDFPGYYLAGTDEETVYLGNTRIPEHLLKVAIPGNDTSHRHIDLPFSTYNSIKVRIDPPYLSLADGSMGMLYVGDMATSDLEPAISNMPFSAAIPFSARSFALSCVVNKENTLAKYDRSRGGTLQPIPVLKKQIDGIFCTEGQLLYNPSDALLVYVYRYRNQYVCMDTSLEVISQPTTIDTTTFANIKVAKQNENTYILSSPPRAVNKRSFLYNDLLFVQSGTRASNEHRDDFRESHPIDVYQARSGIYRFSFHLPKRYNAKVLTDFAIMDNHRVVAIYGDYLTAFSLSTHLFQ